MYILSFDALRMRENRNDKHKNYYISHIICMQNGSFVSTKNCLDFIFDLIKLVGTFLKKHIGSDYAAERQMFIIPIYSPEQAKQ